MCERFWTLPDELAVLVDETGTDAETADLAAAIIEAEDAMDAAMVESILASRDAVLAADADYAETAITLLEQAYESQATETGAEGTGPGARSETARGGKEEGRAESAAEEVTDLLTFADQCRMDAWTAVGFPARGMCPPNFSYKILVLDRSCAIPVIHSIQLEMDA